MFTYVCDNTEIDKYIGGAGDKRGGKRENGRRLDTHEHTHTYTNARTHIHTMFVR